MSLTFTACFYGGRKYVVGQRPTMAVEKSSFSNKIIFIGYRLWNFNSASLACPNFSGVTRLYVLKFVEQVMQNDFGKIFGTNND